MDTTGRRPPTVVIVGGGVSGASVALFLNRLAPDAVQIEIVEPRAQIGRGLAYATTDQVHRINVPAARMELYADDPDHFHRWCETSGVIRDDPAASLPAGRHFPSRHAFGTYVGEQLAATTGISHLRDLAVDMTRTNSGYRVTCADGRTVDARIAVLAVCHPAPTIPAVLRSVVDSDRIIADPWRVAAFDDIAPDERLLIVGTGLTMADVVATLDGHGHSGKVLAISRRGQHAREHAAIPAEPYGEFLTPPATTATALVRRIRRTIASAAQDGISWHAVIDQVRIQGSDIWHALPISERQRLLRHLRPFWDTHRFRLAPQIHDILQRRLQDGSLMLRAATIQSVAQDRGQLTVTLRERRTGSVSRETVDRIILATGPAHGALFRDDPLLRRLQQRGLARPDPYGLGIDVDLESCALDADGHAQPGLFVAGPLARGTFGELMGVPDVARHARRAAETIASLLR
jgi:uncharacterized NAD(P)/FAD-binding protein YdhS